MRVYIAGPIEGIKNYKENFEKAEKDLIEMGFDEVYNPAKNQGFSYKDYIDIGLFELSRSETIYMLKGWKESLGASLEYRYASITGLNIMFE